MPDEHILETLKNYLSFFINEISEWMNQVFLERPLESHNSINYSFNFMF